LENFEFAEVSNDVSAQPSKWLSGASMVISSRGVFFAVLKQANGNFSEWIFNALSLSLFIRESSICSSLVLHTCFKDKWVVPCRMLSFVVFELVHTWLNYGDLAIICQQYVLKSNS
jgi:hypothetical protein